jgi:hypothetical protein
VYARVKYLNEIFYSPVYRIYRCDKETMYNNSRVTPYTNRSARPFRVDHSCWSLDTPINVNASSPAPVTVLSSSVYLPHSPPVKPLRTPDYMNCYPPPSQYFSNYDRPKSTIICDSISQSPSTFHVNDLRQRYETKAVVGIVKPMIHERSYSQLNSNDNLGKASDLTMTYPYHQNSPRLSHPPPTPVPMSSSSVIYRTRPTLLSNNLNSQPPIAPRRLSSISTDKRTSSHRSSRTTSTSSSMVGLNELASRASIHETESHNGESTTVVDVKRLEMFYGSVGTLVKAARSIAQLYITTTRQLANFEDWSCQQLGVPVWIYNTVRILRSLL